ncbi:MAG: M20 family metallopeptidase [Candidatus Limnocylindrales bacterium]
MSIDHGALVEVVQALVRVPSVYEPSTGRSEEGAARLVAHQLRDFGWTPEMDPVAPGRPNVYAVVEGGRPGPTLMFEGHTDVVTEGDPDAWTTDPFGADIRDGRLYGRGSADMKSGLVAALFAARAVADEGPFPGRIVLAALVDEEGMMAGARHFVSTGRAAGIDAAICCEPEDGEVCNVSKGALRLRVDFTGAMAHGAMPFQGRNPNPVLASFLSRLTAAELDLQARHPAHPHLGQVHLTPTVLRAGQPAQMNVIPAEASVWLDVRTIPDVDHEGVVSMVGALARAAGRDAGVDASAEVIDDRPAVSTPETSPVVRALCDAHTAVTGEPARLGGVPGATDGTVLTARTGMPTVVYGPGGKWIAHQVDEFVEVDAIVEAAEVYRETALRFLASAGR